MGSGGTYKQPQNIEMEMLEYVLGTIRPENCFKINLSIFIFILSKELLCFLQLLRRFNPAEPMV